MDMSGTSSTYGGGMVGYDHFLAKVYWICIGSVIALAVVLNFYDKAALWIRCKYRRKNLSRKPNFWSKTITWILGVSRELTYPQAVLSTKWSPKLFSLPPLGIIFLVAFYFIFILIIMLVDVVKHDIYYYERIGYRCAWISVCQIPLLILLAGKKNLIGFATGVSYERLNIIHRWVARAMLLTTTMHWSFFFSEWRKYGEVRSELQTMTMVKYGFGAWSVLAWMVLSSFAPIRNMRYELFVAQHILAFFAFIVLIMLHTPNEAHKYIWIAIGFYLADRMLRAFFLIANNLGWRRNVNHFASAKLQPLTESTTLITIPNTMLLNWSPGQHIILYMPKVSPFQSHPFTIASCPGSSDIQLLVQSRSGFTRRLYSVARRDNTHLHAAFIDGPYGSHPKWEAFDTVVLIGGGSGVSFILPVLEQVMKKPLCVRRLVWVWAMKSKLHMEWCKKRLESITENYKSQVQIEHLSIQLYVTCDETLFSEELQPIIKKRNKPDTICQKCNQGCKCRSTVDPPNSEILGVSGNDADSLDSIQPIVGESGAENKVCSCCLGVYSEEDFGDELSEEEGSDKKDFSRSPKEISIKTGRPNIEKVLESAFEEAMGETVVGVCGPIGLSAAVRNTTAKLSDERGAGKGTGAHAIRLHCETFGW